MKCYCCGGDGSEEMFTKDKSNSRGFHGYCKKCKYSKAKERKAWLDSRIKSQRIQYRRDQKLKAIEYKGGSCIDCGYNEHPAALCFHHIEEKVFDIGELIKYSFERAREELDKCVLLCHNCHDIRHYGSWKGRRHGRPKKGEKNE